MAFVRWRGNSATLLTTVYEQGKSRQVLLAALGSGYSVPMGVQESVTHRYPTLSVDWKAVNRAMAIGPTRDTPLTEKQRTYLEVEQQLREWATRQETPFRDESQQLLAAAGVLNAWRTRQNESADDLYAVRKKRRNS